MTCRGDMAVPDLLAEADRLAHEGRGLEAIRQLTHAKRARDAQVEERLVTLRHEVFATLARRSPAALPPKVVREEHAAPFTGTDPRDLDLARLHRGLAHHGCVWVRGLIPPERAGALARGIDRALGAFDKCEATGADAESPWYVPFRTPDAGRFAWRRRGWACARAAACWRPTRPACCSS